MASSTSASLRAVCLAPCVTAAAGCDAKHLAQDHDAVGQRQRLAVAVDVELGLIGRDVCRIWVASRWAPARGARHQAAPR